MIYTIGQKDFFEGYIATDNNPRLATLASVWPTREEAEHSLDSMGGVIECHECLVSAAIYGVDANWDEKDVQNKDNRPGPGLLTHPARLIKLAS